MLQDLKDPLALQELLNMLLDLLVPLAIPVVLAPREKKETLAQLDMLVLQVRKIEKSKF